MARKPGSKPGLPQKMGGFKLVILQRDKGSVTQAFEVYGRARNDGTLQTTAHLIVEGDTDYHQTKPRHARRVPALRLSAGDRGQRGGHDPQKETDMRREISNRADVLDSRDIIARIKELEDERDDFTDSPQSREGLDPDDEPHTWAETFEDDAAELTALRALAEEGESLSDWAHGETLIRDSYFEDYARELAEDIGAIGKDLPWPACHIDWEAAADALKQDYTSLEYGGVTYWARS